MVNQLPPAVPALQPLRKTEPTHHLEALLGTAEGTAAARGAEDLVLPKTDDAQDDAGEQRGGDEDEVNDGDG
jgi:hypothetical protein